jgi:hypothetical protein
VRLVLLAAVVLALVFAPTAGADMYWPGDDGGDPSWWAMPCNDYYFGFRAIIGGVEAICVNDGNIWLWWPL